MIKNKQDYLNHIEGLSALFERSFGREVNLEFLKWRYTENPIPEMLVNIEKNDGQILANYSASPVKMKFFGEVIHTALSMTTMTDPLHAGKGLFPKLAAELYDFMEKNEYTLVWGFPNNNSHRGFIQKLGWKDVYEIPTMKLSVSGEPATGSGTYETDNQFDLRYEEIEPVKNGIYVLKDVQYLRWRYGNHPTNDYTNLVIRAGDEATSFCVIKMYGSALDIVDFQPKNQEEGSRLLSQVIAFAQQKNLKAINCWAPRHHFSHHLYEKLGFVNSEPITYFGLRSFNGADDSTLLDFNQWYIQMGDSDVY